MFFLEASPDHSTTELQCPCLRCCPAKDGGRASPHPSPPVSQCPVVLTPSHTSVEAVGQGSPGAAGLCRGRAENSLRWEGSGAGRQRITSLVAVYPCSLARTTLSADCTTRPSGSLGRLPCTRQVSWPLPPNASCAPGSSSQPENTPFQTLPVENHCHPW